MTDQWYIPPALFVLLVLLVAAAKNPLEEQVLVAGMRQNLSNLLFLDIYDIYDNNNKIKFCASFQHIL